MPNDSTMFHFGNLELKRIGEIDPNDLIFQRKSIRGWWLHEWMLSLPKEELNYWINYVKSDISSNNSILQTDFSKEYKLEDLPKAFEIYLTNPSEGKVIIKP